MSAVAANLGVTTAASASRVARLLGSSIGQKAVMAVTGVILCGFILVHMAGNLTAFEGAPAMDAYSAALRKTPPLLWAVRLTLLSAALLHVWAYLALTQTSLTARPQGYRAVTHQESSFASRTMRWTGPILLAFIIYHLLHLTVGSVHPNFVEGAVYRNVVTGLSSVPVALFYLVAVASLGVHVFHGVWSLFQTLGIGQARYGSPGRRIATTFTIVVAFGFALIPLAVLVGILK